MLNVLLDHMQEIIFNIQAFSKKIWLKANLLTPPTLRQAMRDVLEVESRLLKIGFVALRIHKKISCLKTYVLDWEKNYSKNDRF